VTVASNSLPGPLYGFGATAILASRTTGTAVRVLPILADVNNPGILNFAYTTAQVITELIPLANALNYPWYHTAAVNGTKEMR
jgi:hypothetical protein